MCQVCETTTIETDKIQQYINNRRFRYEMLNTASGLLRVQQNKKGLYVPHRISTCSKHVPKYGKGAMMGGIIISKNANGRAYLSGINVCSNVWGCPVCAEKIGSKRAVEVTTAVSRHVVDNKGWGLFLTLTFSHRKKDKLINLVNRQSKASQQMRNSRKFKEAMEKLGYIGSIKALEVTHGDNGFHPHTHEVMLIDRKLSPKELADLKLTIFEQWKYYCIKNNLGEPNFNGVDIKIPFNIEGMCDYVGKWGYELTHLNIKHGKNGSRTPFQILSGLTHKYSFKDHMLYEEFVHAFKGKKQLRWSRGLKKMFNIDDKSDKVLNKQPEQEIITVIPKQDWYNILAANQRAEILEIAESGGAQAVKEHLSKIAEILAVARKKSALFREHQKQLSDLKMQFQFEQMPQHQDFINDALYHSEANDFRKNKLLQSLNDQQNNQLTIIKLDEKNLMQKFASNMWGRPHPKNVRQLLYA